MSETPTKTCSRCGLQKPLTGFRGRRKICAQCEDAARQRTLERKEAVVYSEAIAERIVDALASGLTATEICAQGASWPTLRHYKRWQKQHPEFRDACDAAIAERAEVRSDKIDEVLRDLRAGRVSAAEARTYIDAQYRMMALENPQKFNPATKVQTEVSASVTVRDEQTDLDLARRIAFMLGQAAKKIEASRRVVDAEVVPPAACDGEAA